MVFIAGYILQNIIKTLTHFLLLLATVVWLVLLLLLWCDRMWVYAYVFVILVNAKHSCTWWIIIFRENKKFRLLLFAHTNLSLVLCVHAENCENINILLNTIATASLLQTGFLWAWWVCLKRSINICRQCVIAGTQKKSLCVFERVCYLFGFEWNWS